MERRRVLVTYEVTDAWESWIVEVDEDVSDDDILSGRVVPDFLGLDDSGNGSMNPVSVEQ